MRRPASRVLFALIALVPMSGFALDFVVPPPEATLTEGKVRVIGLESAAEKGKAEFAGQSTSFRIKDGSFSISLNLGEGMHEVNFITGDQETKASWKVDPNAKDGVFVYHEGVQDGSCKDCHTDEGEHPAYGTDVSAVCQRCHARYDEKRYVHGPVAMGLCSACHNPHGSEKKAFLWMEQRELCQDCHNEPVTQQHTNRAGNKACLECHDPHQGEKNYQIK